MFAEYARGIRQRSDVVISISTGGGTGMTVEERLQGVHTLRPELCTLNLGTMNYGSFPMIGRYSGQFRYGWEEPYLESTRAEPFVSTYADIEYMLKVVGPETGTRFEAEAYDVSHLYTLAYYLDQGLVQPPIFVQTIFGAMSSWPSCWSWWIDSPSNPMRGPRLRSIDSAGRQSLHSSTAHNARIVHIVNDACRGWAGRVVMISWVPAGHGLVRSQERNMELSRGRSGAADAG